LNSFRKKNFGLPGFRAHHSGGRAEAVFSFKTPISVPGPKNPEKTRRHSASSQQHRRGSRSFRSREGGGGHAEAARPRPVGESRRAPKYTTDGWAGGWRVLQVHARHKWERPSRKTAPEGRFRNGWARTRSSSSLFPGTRRPAEIRKPPEAVEGA